MARLSLSEQREQQRARAKEAEQKKENPPPQKKTWKSRVKRAIGTTALLSGLWAGGTAFNHYKNVQPTVESYTAAVEQEISMQNYRGAKINLGNLKNKFSELDRLPPGVEHVIDPWLQRHSIYAELQADIDAIHPSETIKDVEEWVLTYEKNGSMPSKTDLEKIMVTLGRTKDNFNKLGDTDSVYRISKPGGIEARVLRYDASYAIDTIRSTYLSPNDELGDEKALRMLTVGGSSKTIDPQGKVPKKWSILLGGPLMPEDEQKEAKEVLDHLYLFQSDRIFDHMKDEAKGALSSKNVYTSTDDEGEDEMQTAERMKLIEGHFNRALDLREDMTKMYGALNLEFSNIALDTANDPDNTIPTSDPFPAMKTFLETAYVRYIEELSTELTDISRALKTGKSDNLESNIQKMDGVIRELRDLRTRHKDYTDNETIGKSLDRIEDKIEEGSRDLIEGALKYWDRSIAKYEISEHRDEEAFFENLEEQIELIKTEIELYENSGGNSVKAEEYLDRLSELTPKAYSRFIVAERLASKDVIRRIVAKQISVDKGLEEIDGFNDNAKKYLAKVYETTDDVDAQNDLSSIVKEIGSLKTVAQCQGGFIAIGESIESALEQTEYNGDIFDDMLEKMETCENGLSSYSGTSESIEALQDDLSLTHKEIRIAWVQHALNVAEAGYKKYVGLNVDENDKRTPNFYKGVADTAILVADEQLRKAREFDATKAEVKDLERMKKDVQDILKFYDVIQSRNKIMEYKCETASLATLQSTIYDALGDEKRKVKRAAAKLGKGNVETRQALEQSIEEVVLTKYLECQDRAETLYQERKKAGANPEDILEALYVQRDFLDIVVKLDPDMKEKEKRVMRDIGRYEKKLD